QNLPNVPHLQGADRVALARRAVENLGSEVLILDDGFQHRRLHRDLDLVLVDATTPWGYGQPWGHERLFPRGLLREPLAGLARADVIVLTRCDQVEPQALEILEQRIRQLAPKTAVLQTRHRPDAWISAEGVVRPIENWPRKRAVAFCGIGNPQAFR